jgi:diadenosine tetraphosphate (Ap4A) HIT family hydrolase
VHSDCLFCVTEVHAAALLADEFCFAVWTEDTGIPVGSAMVLPKAHRETVFDLTEAEWRSTMELLRKLREVIDALHQPAGYNVGWNVHAVGGQSIPHAHCHLVPRYAGEPYAGRGIRWWIKDPTNRPTGS